jgi:transposase
MPKERRKYSKGFKMEAIQVYENGERSAHQVERELGITQGLLGKWKTALKRRPQKEDAFLGNGRVTDSEARIRQLEREIATLNEDKEVLRKALEMFSRMTDENWFVETYQRKFGGRMGLLRGISRSGYFAWKKRKPTQR